MRPLDEIITDLIKSGQFCEITINGDGYDFDITGYSGYDAQRFSEIEKTEIGKEFGDKMRELITRSKE